MLSKLLLKFSLNANDGNIPISYWFILLTNVPLRSKLWKERSSHQYASGVSLKILFETVSLWLTSSPCLKYVFQLSIKDLNLIMSNLLDIVRITLLPYRYAGGQRFIFTWQGFYESKRFHKSPIISEFTAVMAYDTNISARCECRHWLCV